MHRIRLTPAVVELFRERRVFLRHPNDPAPLPQWLGFEGECELEAYSHIFMAPWLPLRMGAFSYTHSKIAPHVTAGRFCSIGSEIRWIGETHPMDWVSTHPFAYSNPPLPGVAAFCADNGFDLTLETFEPGRQGVNIGHDAWIGQGASIMSGVRIGVGAVVAAAALVTADVEPYTVVGGVPAKPIRRRFSDALIARLLDSEWWDFNPADIGRLGFGDPAGFLDRLDTLKPSLTKLKVPTLSAHEMLQAASS